MPWSIPKEEACNIVCEYEGGELIRDLALRYRVSRGAVARMLAYYYDTGFVPEAGTHPHRFADHEKRVTDVDRDIHLTNIFDEDPSYYISEARTLLNQRTGKSYSVYAVIRAMERMGLSLKAVRFSPFAKVSF